MAEKCIANEITNMSDKDLDIFVRERLEFTNHELQQLHLVVDMDKKYPHKRFDMSGYGDMCGSCTMHNMSIVNLFADCGIYNQIAFFYLDAYKGIMTLYYKPWDSFETLEEDFAGLGTVEIIKSILHLLVIDNKSACRRTN